RRYHGFGGSMRLVRKSGHGRGGASARLKNQVVYEEDSMGDGEKSVVQRGKRYMLRMDGRTREVVAVWPAGDDSLGKNTWWVRDASGSEQQVQSDKLTAV